MKLSVIVPVYNMASEEKLNWCMDSLVNQTISDYEIIAVDDCSTDNSVEIVKQYFEEYPRQYEIVTMSCNKGLCAGRRYVEENTETKYLLFVDADDRPLPQYVEKLYDKITSDPQLMAVGCYLEYINIYGERFH